MNAKRLLQHLERIADAPDGVPRLRRFVLDLAVRDTNRSVSDAARKSLATLRFSNNEQYAATVPEAPSR